MIDSQCRRSRSSARRIAVSAVLLAAAFVAGSFMLPAQAQAQAQAPSGQARNARPEQQQPRTAVADRATVAQRSLNGDNKLHAVMFWLFALLTIGGAIFVITRRNLISAVMGMVATFFAIAAVYVMLNAHFLAAIQVLVYAGAIMVLFVFVIMILNKPEDEPWNAAGLVGKGVVSLVILYLLGRLIQVLWSVVPPLSALSEPPQTVIPMGTETELVDFGTTMALGQNLFNDYLFPFEAVSLVLLIAIVGAIAVARPHEAGPTALTDGPSADAPDDSANA